MAGLLQQLTQYPTRWFPAEWIDRPDAQPEIGWLHIDQPRFTQPFFSDTCQTAMRVPANQVFRPSLNLSEIRAMARDCKATPLHGLIFHVSRCGSTLLAQALAHAPHNLVLSEPPVLDRLLRINDDADVISRDEQIATLQALVHLMGAQRFEGQQRLFIKLDAWHLLYATLLQEAFAEAPNLILYRDPLEVLVSQQRQPGLFTIPSYLPRHWTQTQQDSPMTLMDYQVRLMRALYGAAHHLDATGQSLVNFTELPDALSGRCLSILGLHPEDLPQSVIADVTSRHSKRQETYSPDSAEKQTSASPELIAATDAMVRPHYQQLEHLRLSRDR